MTTTPTTLTIDGVTYIREDATTPAEPAEVRIVILQRGWVMVGRWHRDGDDITLTDASVIRRWGTSKGLGELVNGPLSGTTLDQAGAGMRCVVEVRSRGPAGEGPGGARHHRH